MDATRAPPHSEKPGPGRARGPAAPRGDGARKPEWTLFLKSFKANDANNFYEAFNS
jgi:hypothetical protein